MQSHYIGDLLVAFMPKVCLSQISSEWEKYINFFLYIPPRGDVLISFL